MRTEVRKADLSIGSAVPRVAGLLSSRQRGDSGRLVASHCARSRKAAGLADMLCKGTKA